MFATIRRVGAARKRQVLSPRNRPKNQMSNTRSAAMQAWCVQFTLSLCSRSNCSCTNSSTATGNTARCARTVQLNIQLDARATFLARCTAECPPNALMIADRPDVATHFATVEEVFRVVFAIAMVALLVSRLLLATRPRRRILAPVYVVGCVWIAVFGLFGAIRYFAVTERCHGVLRVLREVPKEDLLWLLNEAGPTFAGKAKRFWADILGAEDEAKSSRENAQ